MKQKLRLGDYYALTKYQLKQFKIKYFRLLAVLTIMCLYAAKQASAQQAEPAAPAIENIKPLQIGDTIPEWLWHYPLSVVNHPKGKDMITLDDYRNKLIILDFMNTACPSCISKLPILDSLLTPEDQGSQLMVVTSEPDSTVNRFWKRNKITSSLDQPVVVNDSALKKLFPHIYVSHMVWLYMNRVVAITSPEYVTQDNISRVITSSCANLPVKKDAIGYDYNLRMLNTNKDQVELIPGGPVYYSSFFPRLNGVATRIVEHVDTIAETVTIRLINISVANFYRYCLKKNVRNGFILIEGDKAPEFCYEAVFPLAMDEITRRSKIKADVDFYLNKDGRFEYKNASVFLLVKDTSFTGNPPSYKNPGGVEEYLYTSSSRLTNSLNYVFSGTPILNRVNPDEEIHVTVNQQMFQDINLFKRELKKQGFLLQPARENIEMLVISDR